MAEFAKPRFYKNTKGNVLKIFRVLKEAQNESEGYLTISEIARRSGLHRWTVSRTIDLRMAYIVEVIIPEELEQVGLRIKLARLAGPGITEKGVVRGLNIRL